MQSLPSMVRYGRVEEMCERMVAKEIEIDSVGMGLRSLARPWWNGRPVHGDACQMYSLDLLPVAEPMNLALHLAMIGGHCDEDGQEQGQRQIAAVIPVKLIEGYGAHEASEENRQAPSCERSASLGAASHEAVGAPDDGFDLGGACACHHRRPYWERAGTSNSEPSSAERIWCHGHV